MSKKVPIDEAVDNAFKGILETMSTEVLMKELTAMKGIAEDYNNHVLTTFNLHHDLYAAINATATLHDLDENGRRVTEFVKAQVAVNCAILCGDWPDDILYLPNCDAAFVKAYQEAIAELERRVGGNE